MIRNYPVARLPFGACRHCSTANPSPAFAPSRDTANHARPLPRARARMVRSLAAQRTSIASGPAKSEGLAGGIRLVGALLEGRVSAPAVRWLLGACGAHRALTRLRTFNARPRMHAVPATVSIRAQAKSRGVSADTVGRFGLPKSLWGVSALSGQTHRHGCRPCLTDTVQTRFRHGGLVIEWLHEVMLSFASGAAVARVDVAFFDQSLQRDQQVAAVALHIAADVSGAGARVA